MVHLHNGILCSRKKEWIPIFCDSLFGNGDCYAKCNKPGDEQQYHMISLIRGI